MDMIRIRIFEVMYPTLSRHTIYLPRFQDLKDIGLENMNGDNCLD